MKLPIAKNMFFLKDIALNINMNKKKNREDKYQLSVFLIYRNGLLRFKTHKLTDDPYKESYFNECSELLVKRFWRHLGAA